MSNDTKYKSFERKCVDENEKEHINDVCTTHTPNVIKKGFLWILGSILLKLAYKLGKKSSLELICVSMGKLP